MKNKLLYFILATNCFIQAGDSANSATTNQVIDQINSTTQITAETTQALTNTSVLFAQFITNISNVSADRAALISNLTSKFSQLKQDFYTIRDKLLAENQANQQINTNLNQLNNIVSNLDSDKNNLVAQVAQLEADYNNLLNQSTQDSELLLAKIIELQNASNQLAAQKQQFILDMANVIQSLQVHADTEAQDNQSLLQLVTNLEGDLAIIDTILQQAS